MIIAASKYGLSAARLPLYEYTGQAPLFFKDSQGNWEIVFTGDCTVTFSRLHGAVDIFAVGGGMPAGESSGSITNKTAYGGNGGRGGGCVTDPGRTLTVGQSYPVQIGASSLSTSAFGVTAPAGGGSNGGTGSNGYAVAGNATDGVLAFGRDTEADLTLYEASLGDSAVKFGAGGGGGAARRGWDYSLFAASSGGATGGGNGGSGGDDEFTLGSRDGKPNTGGGGGGGSRNNATGSGGNFPGPGAGGSGIVIIRNARSI